MNCEFANEIMFFVLSLTNQSPTPIEDQESVKLERKFDLYKKELTVNLRCFNMDYVQLNDITNLINNMNEMVRL